MQIGGLYKNMKLKWFKSARNRFIEARAPMSDDELIRSTCTPESDRHYMIAVRAAVGKACRIPHQYILPTEPLDFMSMESELFDPVSFVNSLEEDLGIEISNDSAQSFPSPWPVRRWFKIIEPAPENFIAWARAVVKHVHELESEMKTG